MRLPNLRTGRLVASIVAVASAAACGRNATAKDASLQHDLEMVGGGQGLELAPHAAGQTTVSAVELIPSGNRRTASASHATPKHREQPVASPEPKVAVTAPANSTTRDSAVASAPATPRPNAATAVSPAPPGGYRTMGELIRKAPFPINP